MIIKDNFTKKHYNIHICSNMEKTLFMIKYMEQYIQNSNIKTHTIGVDFEFNRVNNKRRIALCQINMEIKDNNMAYIFMFYPPDIIKRSNLTKSNIFTRLLTCTNIIKILHGGESLDIPYLFSEVFETNEEIDNFCKNMFDTKTMCEYYNISNNLINNKCKIYELLHQMDVIDMKKYNELIENDKKMGNIWEINIDTKNMSQRVTMYCLYDVLYLPALLNAFPKNNIYRYILPSINNYNLILRHNSSDNISYHDIIFKNISKYNMNTIILNNIKYTYQDIYISIYYLLSSDNYYFYLFQINYLKKFFEIIIKNFLYQQLNIKHTNYNDMLNIKKYKYLMIFQSKLIKDINSYIK